MQGYFFHEQENLGKRFKGFQFWKLSRKTCNMIEENTQEGCMRKDSVVGATQVLWTNVSGHSLPESI